MSVEITLDFNRNLKLNRNNLHGCGRLDWSGGGWVGLASSSPLQGGGYMPGNEKGRKYYYNTKPEQSSVSTGRGWNKLNARDHRFVSNYLRTLDPVQAMKDAGFPKNKQNGKAASDFLKKPNVKAEIAEQIRIRCLSVDTEPAEILRQLSAILKGDITNYASWDEHGFYTKTSEEIKEMSPYAGAVIKKINRKRDGEITIELHDKMRAIELLGKYFNMFNENGPTSDVEINVNIEGVNPQPEVKPLVVGENDKD